MMEKCNRPAGDNGRAAGVWTRFNQGHFSTAGGRCLGGGDVDDH